jgi:hypothetical protein
MHIAASVGYFIEYIMMHGTINIKKLGLVQKGKDDCANKMGLQGLRTIQWVKKL